MRVLVADDDPIYRSLLEGLLSEWHFEPLVVCDGLEAMEAMESEDPPQLVILDWEMPELDGFEVARSIRHQSCGQDAYILMITGSRRKDDMMQVLVSGADDYLMKPFEPIDLKIHLRSAMRIMHLREEIETLRAAEGRRSEAGTAKSSTG